MWLRFYIFLFLLFYSSAAPLRNKALAPFVNLYNNEKVVKEDEMVSESNSNFLSEISEGFADKGVVETADGSGGDIYTFAIEISDFGSSGDDISHLIDSSGNGNEEGSGDGSGDSFYNVGEGSSGDDIFISMDSSGNGNEEGSGDGSGDSLYDVKPIQKKKRRRRGIVDSVIQSLPEFRSFNLDPPRLTKNNFAAESFYRECSGSGKDCRGNSPQVSPISAPGTAGPDAKKRKLNDDETGQETDDTMLSPGILEPPEVEECYFAHVRISVEETMPRSKQSDVSTECYGDNLISFGTLIEDEIDVFGTTNVAQIILERGGGEFGLNFENSDIKNEIGNRKLCPKHYEELFQKWEQQKYGHYLRSKRKSGTPQVVCSMDDRYQPHQARPFIDKNSVKVTSRHASSFLKKTGILIHVGLPVCESHGKALDKISAEHIVEEEGFSIVPSYDDFGHSPQINVPVDEDLCIAPDDNDASPKCSKGSFSESSSSSSQDSSKDPSFKPPRVSRLPPLIEPSTCSVKDETKEAFYSFAKSTGEKRYKLKKGQSFEKLERRTKQKKAALYNYFMDIIANIMTDDKKNELISMADSKKKVLDWTKTPDKQMETALACIKQQYNVAQNRDMRLNVVAQVAHVYPLAAVQTAIPGLTRRFFTDARKKAKQRLERPDAPKEKRKTKRYSEAAVKEFVDFITSPPVSTMLPSAFIKVKKPDGTKTEIPGVMRRFHDGEVIDMFEKYCEEDENAECGLSHYVMRTILKVCSAKHQKSLHCVDYFLAIGQEAFLKIKQTISKLLDMGLINEQWFDYLELGCQESENYLKTDYYTQLKLFSRIGDLCMVYSLSDPNIKEFKAQDCSILNTEAHQHDLQTDRIRLFDRTIIDLRDILTQVIEEATDDSQKETLSEMRGEIFQSEKNIIKWKEHIVRAKFSNHQRLEILSSLKEGEALVTVDYAMRYLPTKHIEMQSDWYAKKGLSWHISHIITKIGELFVQHTVTHLMDEEDQNGQAVIAILTDVFKKLKKWNIDKVTIRSDNAGYYKNAQVLVSLPVIADEIGIELGRYSFSETQSGKAEADREGGRMKRRMYYFLNHGGDILCGNDMLAAITSGTVPLSGLTVVVAKLNYVEVVKKPTIPIISNLYDFVYGNGKIKYWKHFGIGTGKEIKQNTFKESVIKPTLTITNEWDHSPEDSSYTFWMSTKQDEKERSQASPTPIVEAAVVDPEETSSYIPTKLFSCPVANCEAQFSYHGNLFNHLIIGKHQFAVEKTTLQEFAFKLYQNQLEGFVESRQTSLRQRGLENEGVSTDNQPEMGWALKKNKKGARYTSDMRAFLDVEFVKYFNKQKKPDVKEVESSMASARVAGGKRRFTVEQRLDSRQIGAYYKRKFEKLRDQLVNGQNLNDEQQEEVSDTIIQQMNDETGEIEVEIEDEPMFNEGYEEVLECAKINFGGMEESSADAEDSNYNHLYADEEELVNLFQQQRQIS